MWVVYLLMALLVIPIILAYWQTTEESVGGEGWKRWLKVVVIFLFVLLLLYLVGSQGTDWGENLWA